ncbi:hypothetical protein AB0N59_04840 [Microbacterium sp. NPDC089321]|uniref:hypothetical protein n=1 Tax=Microbacterium sp. NPDC089321 TaxID=3155183 RepID=UPI003433C255
MTENIDFTDELVSRDLLDLLPDTISATSVVFAGGSLVEGFGNSTSDVDLIAIHPDDEKVRGHGGVRMDDTVVLTSRYRGRRVDIELVKAGTFERTVELLTAHDEDRRRVLEIPREFLTTLNSLRIGIPLAQKARFYEIRDSFPWRSLLRMIADDADRQYQATSEDAIGAIRCGDAGTAMLSSRAALGHAIDAFIAAAGHSNTRRKWRIRKMEALGETDLLNRYLDLEADVSLAHDDLLAQSRRRIKFAQKLLLDVHTRNGEQG